MSSLRSKSADELAELLDEYGIKHGPVVDSTRGLYEKKLKEAMAKGKPQRPSPDRTYYREEEEEVTYVHRTPVRNESSADSELYRRPRAEQTEWEFGTEKFDSSSSWPVAGYRGKDFEEKLYSSSSQPAALYRERDFDEKLYSSSSRPAALYRERDFDEPYTYTPSTYRNISLKQTAKSAENLPGEKKSSRLIPLWIQFVVFFLVVAFFFYFVFSNMETTVTDPFQKIE
ncbi:emerin-like isoform X1 [Thalassophryne amazonica]|uniref:emerin-like isoform X1 n=1 Tax=Thalassophryne amazonica TaxID=390379 RepID=UPI00147233C5|nr:emerin-like isoform X1 [Thalassophryne amazonica]